MHKFIYTALLFSILFYCCSNHNETQRELFSLKKAEKLILSAAFGNNTANDSLSKLFDLSLPIPKILNKISFDSIIIPKKQKLYSVLIEFPNPIYNRFAIFDTNYNFYLIDKSLNGHLTLNKLSDLNISFFEVIEDFMSKDIIKLKRRNLYLINKDTVSPALKSFASYEDGKIKIVQSIFEINENNILTSITPYSNLKLNFSSDNFLFDKKNNSYSSINNYFDKYINDLIINTKGNNSKPQIIDKISALKSVGVQTSVDSVNKYNNFKNKNDRFSINLPDGWKSQKNIMLAKHLNKPMRGTALINTSQKALFYIIPLQENEQAENIISYKLEKSVEGNYKIRFNEKIEIDRTYFQFFEISCINLKYLVIFEVLKFSYDNNKKSYEDIINSFGIDC